MASAPPQFLLHQDGDNVAVAVADLEPGTVHGAAVKGRTEYSMVLLNSVPLGHKFAMVDIKAGESITKYGIKVGVALADIKAGEYIHVHNMGSDRWQASRA